MDICAPSEWGSVSWQKFTEWHHEGGWGVSLVPGISLYGEDRDPDPWAYIVHGYTMLTPSQCAHYGPQYRYGSQCCNVHNIKYSIL